MQVKVENGKITDITAHPDNRATRSGVCLKGLSYIQRAVSPNRLVEPLQLNRATKRFEPISWDLALETIASKITKFKAESGAHSMFFYAASGMAGQLNSLSTAFWKLAGGATTLYGNLCWPAGLEATRLMLGENKHNAPWDLENAKLIVIWGKNPAETNIQEIMFIQNAIEKGAKVVVIDPRRTETAEKADTLYLIRPGSDAALALAIAHVLIKQQLIDLPFIQNHVLGFDSFKEYVKPWTPERAQAITHIPAGEIIELAQQIGRIKPMSLLAGYGMQRYSNGGQTLRALMALCALTGNIGKPGAGWRYANLQSYVFDAVKEPLNYYPTADASPFRRAVSIARLGEDMLKLHSPTLRMAWVERGNPLTQNPDTNKVKEAFEKLEFKVVVEEFMTDTAQAADIVLPAKNMFEQTDLVTSYWHPYIQLRQKVLDSSGQTKPESEIWYLLAKKLGFSHEQIIKTIPEPNEENTKAFLRLKLEKAGGIDWEALQSGPCLPKNHQEVAFEDLVFKTPSGKIELWSADAKKQWKVNELPSFDELEELNDEENEDYPLFLLSPCTKNRIHSQFGNLGWIETLDPEPFAQIHPSDAAERGISHNSLIEIFNERGIIKVKANVTQGIKRGCISISNGWWNASGGNPNFLSKGRETDMGHGTAFHNNMVEVRKADFNQL
jgi:anaerobic selenocysteine-containing dehydrogenase